MELASDVKIKAIDVNTVHRICSGQVVLSLAVAVKELVENSLDSGATAVEIRFSEHGKDLVEVSDNGSGISDDNHEALCLKHFTSKIRNFEDVSFVETFGFRGEALSSLCALSKVIVITCMKNEKIGWKLEYDSSGKLTRKTQYPRQPGTTVMLHDLFSTLPVRHKEFTRNLRREFDKAINLLTGYCLISKSIRFTCMNVHKGKRTAVLSTHGSSSLMDNITNIYGPKFVRSLLKIEKVSIPEEILAQFGLNPETAECGDADFSLEGFISSCVHGQGRSSSDRQFYFVNGRPCEPSKLSKLVNEVYRSFNRDQYPFVLLNVTVDRKMVDVNVTPDKRQLLLTNEKLLLATVKAALMNLYENLPSTFTLQNTNLLSEDPESISESQEDIAEAAETEKIEVYEENQLSRFSSQTVSKFSQFPVGKRKAEFTSPQPKQKCIDTFFKRHFSHPVTEIKVAKPKNMEFHDPDSLTAAEKLENIVPTECHKTSVVETLKETNLNTSITTEGCFESIKIIESTEELAAVLDEIVPAASDELRYSEPRETSELSRETVTINLSLQQLKEEVKSQESSANSAVSSRKFFARIKPEDAKDAEAELNRQFKKGDFAKMDVIGQFNLGFIIACLDDDLFIVDQHAADEKYFFETLQKKTVIQSQRLVCPKLLNLTAVNESLLIENLCIFKRNGFDFYIDPDAEPTKRVHLSAVPMSKNFVFGPGDVDELLFMLQDAPWGEIEESQLTDQIMAQCRPSRVRSMFASRACHTATRVGDPLTLGQMKKLLEQMTELNQPWNCPHGRPTMRHLVNLHMLSE